MDIITDTNTEPYSEQKNGIAIVIDYGTMGSTEVAGSKGRSTELQNNHEAPKGKEMEKNYRLSAVSANSTCTEIFSDVTQEQNPIAKSIMRPTDHDTLQKHKRRARAFCHCCILTPLIVIVWLLFALPTLSYILHKMIISTTASEYRSETRCFSSKINYTGSVCESELREWQQCFSGGGASGGLNDVLIPSDIDQDTVEADARSLLELGLPFVNPSVECETALKSFMCLYLFGLCDTDNTFHQALQEDCVRVRDEICPREWGIVTELLQANPSLGNLPQCEDLSSEPSTCFQQGNVTTTRLSGGFIREDIALESANITECTEGFYLNGNSCRPECGDWAPPEYNILSNKVLDKCLYITGIAIALTSATLFVLIATTCQRKHILVYPSIYLLYVMVIVFVLAPILLISTVSDEKTLFCHSRDLLEAFENGTVFCSITGIVYCYTLLQVTMWLLFHAGALFWGIVFPFHYRRWKNEGRLKYVHITTVVLALLVPTISPITTLLVDGYSTFTIPTYYCLGKNADVLYATMVLPISICGAIGSSLLIIIFWTILKHFIIKKISKTKAKINVTKAQVKIMVILCFYILLGIFVMVATTNSTSLRKYFLCQNSDKEDCDSLPTTFNFSALGKLYVLANILESLVPIVVLLFGLNIRKVNLKKQLGSLRTLCIKFRKRPNIF